MAPRNLQLFRALFLVATCCFLFASISSAQTDVSDLNKVFTQTRVGFGKKGPVTFSADARKQFINGHTKLDALFATTPDDCKETLDTLVEAEDAITLSAAQVAKCGPPAKEYENLTKVLKELPSTGSPPQVEYAKQKLPAGINFFWTGQDLTSKTSLAFKAWFLLLDADEPKKKEWETKTKADTQTDMTTIRDLSEDDYKLGYGYTKDMLTNQLASIKATGIVMSSARRLAVSVIAIAMSVFAILF